jgi:hypothetical protein
LSAGQNHVTELLGSDRQHPRQKPDGSHMLWTILIILAIVALVVFILSRVRGRRGV